MFRGHVLDVNESVVFDVQCVSSECPRKPNPPLGKQSVPPAKRGNRLSVGNEERSEQDIGLAVRHLDLSVESDEVGELLSRCPPWSPAYSLEHRTPNNTAPYPCTSRLSSKE
jgi:hypothetical protein